MTFGLIGKFTARAGERDVLVRVLLEAADLLQRNADCLHYVISTSDEPDAVWVSEVWTNREAHAASLAADDIRSLIEEARPLIAGFSDRTELSIQGGKGVSS